MAIAPWQDNNSAATTSNPHTNGTDVCQPRNHGGGRQEPNGRAFAQSAGSKIEIVANTAKAGASLRIAGSLPQRVGTPLRVAAVAAGRSRLERIAVAPRRRRGDHQKAGTLLIARDHRGSNAVAGAAALAMANLGVVVTPELLQRVAAMPVTRKHTAWGFRRRAALANMVIPREQQCYPRSALPASKFEHGEESR